MCFCVAVCAASLGGSFDDFKIKLEPCSSPIPDHLDHPDLDDIPTTRPPLQSTPPHHLTNATYASARIKKSPSFKATKFVRTNKRYFIHANPKTNTGVAVTNTHATRGHNDLRISHPMSWALETYLEEKPNIVTVVGDASNTSNSTTVPTSSSTTGFIRAANLTGRHHHSTSMVNATNKFRNKSVKSTSKSHVVLSMASAADAREQTLRRIKRESLTHGDEMVYNGGDAKPWTCRNCKRKYKWKNSLNCHIKNECGKPPKFFCERQCGYKTNINSNLKRHLNSNCKPRAMDETNWGGFEEEEESVDRWERARPTFMEP